MSMRKSRKLISLAIAVVFLLSAMVPAAAFAAGHADDQAEAGARLKALGVIEGFPDGSLGVERNITRAEMAVVLAKMSGNDSASRVLMNVPSTFSDVQTGVWYTGYINLASQQGWVAGYPDGTYKPNAPVSYAEAVTMMLNVLGYEGARLPGTWPSNYLVKAAQLGLTDGVSFTANSPAPRGDVFIFASAALDEEPVVWDSDTNRYVAEVDGETLLDRLGFEVKEFRIAEYFALLGSNDDEKEDRLAVDTEGDEWFVAEGICVLAYVGVETEFYVDGDVIVSVKSAETVLTGEIEDFYKDGDDYKVEFDGSSTVFTVDADVVVVINRAIETDLDTLVGFEGFVTYTRTSRTITSMNIVDYGAMREDVGFGVVDEVDVDGNFVDIEMYVGVDANLDLDDVDALYFVGVSSVDEIEEWDVLYWNQVNDDYVIYVVRDQVSGTVTRYRNQDFVRVGGTNYDVSSPEYWTTPDMGGRFIEKGDFNDFSGESVILLLDGYGDVVVLVGDVEDTAEPSIAITTSEIERNLSFGTFTYRIRLLRANGVEARYNFEDDSVELKGAATFHPGGEAVTASVYNAFVAHGWDETNKSSGLNERVVEYTLNSDGEIELLEFLGPVLDSEDEAELVLDLDDIALNRIGAADAEFTRYFVTSDTVFFENTDEDDPVVLSREDVMDLEGSAKGILYVDGRDIVAVVFTEAAVSDEDYAVLIDWFEFDGDVYVELMTADGLREFATDYSVAVAETWEENFIVEYTVTSAGEADLTVVSNIYGQLDSNYNATRGTITLKVGGEIDLDPDALVIDNSGSSPRVVSASSLRRNNWVVAFEDNDGLIQAIVIVKDQAAAEKGVPVS